MGATEKSRSRTQPTASEARAKQREALRSTNRMPPKLGPARPSHGVAQRTSWCRRRHRSSNVAVPCLCCYAARTTTAATREREGGGSCGGSEAARAWGGQAGEQGWEGNERREEDKMKGRAGEKGWALQAPGLVGVTTSGSSSRHQGKMPNSQIHKKKEKKKVEELNRNSSVIQNIENIQRKIVGKACMFDS